MNLSLEGASKSPWRHFLIIQKLRITWTLQVQFPSTVSTTQRLPRCGSEAYITYPACKIISSKPFNTIGNNNLELQRKGVRFLATHLRTTIMYYEQFKVLFCGGFYTDFLVCNKWTQLSYVFWGVIQINRKVEKTPQIQVWFIIVT